ncbi:MAG TPA: hypothetical protein VGK29_12690 [Paludibaculum sp.]
MYSPITRSPAVPTSTSRTTITVGPRALAAALLRGLANVLEHERLSVLVV